MVNPLNISKLILLVTCPEHVDSPSKIKQHKCSNAIQTLWNRGMVYMMAKLPPPPHGIDNVNRVHLFGLYLAYNWGTLSSYQEGCATTVKIFLLPGFCHVWKDQAGRTPTSVTHKIHIKLNTDPFKFPGSHIMSWFTYTYLL